MATRKKAPVQAPASTEEVNNLMSSFAKADARKRQITAAMDVKFAEIRDGYAAELDTLEKTMDEAQSKMQVWAESNRKELFEKKKSMDFSHGTIGFRMGTPALKPRKGFQWKGVLELVKQKLNAYVKVEESVDKARLLADRESPEVAQSLNGVGLEVTQTETFYIVPKTEEVTA